MNSADAEGSDRDPVVVDRWSSSGELLGRVSLDPTHFGVGVNVPLLHQVVTAQLAAGRSGTQSTRTRAEVRGGSAKPFRQKGTGNARQGSIRAPHYSGGGVALGPKPRSYVQRTPRKMVQQALRCALSDRAGAGKVCVVDAWTFAAPKTKDAVRFLAMSGCSGTTLVVLGRGDVLAARSFANIPDVITVPGDQLSAYDVLVADHVVFTETTVPGGTVVVDRGRAAAEPAASVPVVASGTATESGVGEPGAGEETK
ncbi:MAG: 50S ribosomal protein L4 [Acidimicrobiales bacterium]